MTITNEMAKVIAGSINKEELKKACIKDVRLACNKFDLDNDGWKSLNESSVYNIWNEYEENQKSYGKYNGSGWSPEW